MQVNKLLHIFHLSPHRQLQPSEYLGHHLGSNIIMVMEGPPHGRLPPLRLRLSDVVEQGGPAEVKPPPNLPRLGEGLLRQTSPNSPHHFVWIGKDFLVPETNLLITQLVEYFSP